MDIKTAGDLKKFLQSIPDDMPVKYIKRENVQISEMTSDIEETEEVLHVEQKQLYWNGKKRLKEPQTIVAFSEG
jgi:hypothetical protein